MLKILFLGKDKPATRRALHYLHQQPDFAVIGLVTDTSTFADFAHGLGITVFTHEQAHGESWETIDLAVSYLYSKRISEPLISSPRLGCINFHPAPLPKYRGVAPYSRAILENEKQYGVSVHFVDKDFDSGDLIGVREFKIDQEKITALGLEQQASRELFLLFVKTMNLFRQGSPPRIPQEPAGAIYTSQQDLDSLREVKASDSPQLVSRKIRAFFYPPHRGAFIKIQGHEFTLFDDDRLSEVASWMKEKSD